MSISGISGTNFSSQQISAQHQRITTDFRQLSKDLESGDFTAAQQDYSSLRVDLQQPGTKATSTATQSGIPSTGGRHHPVPPTYGPPISVLG